MQQAASNQNVQVRAYYDKRRRTAGNDDYLDTTKFNVDRMIVRNLYVSEGSCKASQLKQEDVNLFQY